MDMKHPTTHAD